MAYTIIDDPSAYFHIQLYTGNGTAIGSGGNTITNNANSGDFKPDWTWHKVRSTANDHQVYDSSRGVKIRLNPNATNSDFTLNEGLQSFDTNGFTVGSDGGVNQSSQTFVAWQWKASGGTTASNTDGTITSTVQANTTAGFSIATYTGNGSGGATIGHGLGVAPKWFFVKSRSATGSWIHYHIGTGSTPENDYLNFTTSGKGTTSAAWNNTAPTTSVASLGSSEEVNGNGTTFVGYFFAEKQGYSKFGSYAGNSSADGPFIYTGFKPAWIMFKKTSGTDGWGIFDNRRGYQNATNPLDAYLQPNNNNAESGESDSIDFLSNGFKWRISSGFRNESGSTYIYMAFAESPFVSSEGVPTTAK
jgi:hypothetical protein